MPNPIHRKIQTRYLLLFCGLDSREKQNITAMLRTVSRQKDSMPTGPGSQQNIIGEKNKCWKYTNLHLLLFCAAATVSIRYPEPGIVRESQYLQTHLDTRHHPTLRECDVQIITRLSNIPHSPATS